MPYEPYDSSKDRSNASPATTKPSNYDTLPNVIGGPPTTGTNVIVTENLMRNSGLNILVQPCKPSMQTGLSLFTLDVNTGWDHYTKLLKDVEYKPSALQDGDKGLRIVCQAENFPSDTFQNDYGESFLNQITDVASSGFGQLSQMFGVEKATDAIRSGGGLSKEVGEAMGGTVGSLFEYFGKGLSAGSDSADKFIAANINDTGIKGTIANTMNKLLAGARIDFPMIWKGSSYSPTFSCTIKLYNPNPASLLSTKRYIHAPLAALLTLGLPQSVDMNAYNYPLFCRVDCPGLFKIQAGAISNITVTKGGDAGLVGFNQRVAMVDVRIDFVNLHSTLLLSGNGMENRPTLKGYLDNLLDQTSMDPIYTNQRIDSFNYEAASPASSSGQSEVLDGYEPPPSRVNDDEIRAQSKLTANNPNFYG